MIQELIKMCTQKDFDLEKANELIQQIDVNEKFKKPDYSWNNTLLECASENANFSMVKLLLENGADPDIVADDLGPLWSLQYADGETDKENKDRLKIAQLLLEYGANPLIDPENTNEGLFDYVVFKIFNDDLNDSWEYLVRFFILLVAYGASSDYCTPHIVKEFDKADMSQYKFRFRSEGNGKYSGIITDRNDDIAAYI